MNQKEKEFSADEIYLAPETKFSENSETEKEISPIMELDAGGSRKEPFEVDEIPEMRNSNRKVYHMSDGYEKAVFYPETMHVINSTTKKFDMTDNSLIEEEDGRHIRNGAGAFIARFSKEIENDEIFSVEKDGHKIAVYARKNKKQRNHGTIPQIRKQKLTESDTSERDVISYANVVDGSDMEYSVTGNGVKEDIIVNARSAVYRYPFILQCENVIAEYLENEKTVLFKDPETDQPVFSIPAPFMTDANGTVSTAVSYEFKALTDGKFAFTIIADSDWINAEDRALPVIIDPQIVVQGSSYMSAYSWNNCWLYSSSTHVVGTSGNGDGTCNAKRMYLNFAMPTLPRNPRIKKAELTIKQSSGYCQGGALPKIGLYHVTDDICTGNCTPIHSTDLIDFVQMKTDRGASYTFDITSLIDKVIKGESGYSNFVLKMLDETNTCNNYVVLYGSAYSTTFYKPTISITYENTYGVNTSYRVHSHEIGRFGQGSIDLQCGNLMFESEDFTWAGNRMPVTLKHLYNSALANDQYTNNSSIKLNAANFASMKLGFGWKLNLMQSLMSTTFQHEGISYSGYVYTDENGEETYFKQSTTKQVCDTVNNCCYYVYEDANGSEMYYDQYKHELTIGSDVYLFDAAGRLIRVIDEHKNKMILTYSLGQLTSITDGAGREFGLSYNNDKFLTSITAPDNTVISYSYSGDLLTGITYPDGKIATITYVSNKPQTVVLKNADGKAVYKVAYTFSGNRLTSVTEYGVDDSGNFVRGASSNYSYSVASGRTLVTTTEPMDTDNGETKDNVIKTVYTFDDDGSVISEYVYSEDTGNVAGDGEENGINPHSADSGAGVASNINNLLIGHNFESLNSWSEMPTNCGDLYISNYAYEPYAKFGKKVLRMQSYNAECCENGVYQVTNALPKGQYTFSAYLRVISAFSGNNAGAFIRVTDTAGNVLGVSELLTKYDSEYTRLIVPFELDTAQSVQVQIMVSGKGTVYADAAQLENNPYANAYNMLENGNFERGTSGWSFSSGVGYSTGTKFNMSRSLYMIGDVDSARYAYQQPVIRTTRSTRETFTLSGWAKGYGLPTHERDGVNKPQFRLRAVIKYSDSTYKEYGTEEFVADFSPCTEDWQFASVQFSKSKYRTIQYIRVYCDYGYNSGTVYFDDIQLVRNSLETSLSASEFVIESTGASDNVAESGDSVPTFKEAKDQFGNALTETTFTDGDFGTIYRSFKFNADDNCMAGDDTGNNLVEETDARGHKTTYTVDGDASRNEEVTDRLGNKTAYEYDDSGRTTKVISKKADGTELANVSYAYDTFDNMTEIVRGDGMKYALAYNEFHNLESIGIEGKDEALIKYAYKNGNGRLKQMTYANGHTMRAVYNSIGQMVAEKWFETEAEATSSTATPIVHYRYVYNGDGNIVRSIDISGKKEYNYEYEEGRIVRATEADIELSGEIIISKVVVNTVKYYYDAEGKMTKKVITPASGSAQTTYYETNDDNTVVKFDVPDTENANKKQTITSHSKTDSFGRKVFDELQIGRGFVSRQFSYMPGAITDEHKKQHLIKSTATTQLVSHIALSDGRTISYEYDDEERIIKVTDTIDGTVSYTYDALGQLETETKDGKTTKFEYDNYGNITAKANGIVDEDGEFVEESKITYEYGNEIWRDLLTAYNGQSITYDAQGNPTSYLGHTLTWEKGRQLKSFDGNTYTYNANGIRTSKIVNGIKHEYTFDGTKILRETWDGNTLIPLYDNEDGVCGILYNNVPYYFIKNLQGDIIAIVDKDAKTVARYSYDAWGAVTSAVTHTDLTKGVDIATINPFRYRGYYYDEEIELYYLQSRYYDASVGRFINEDNPVCVCAVAQAQFSSLYAYCDNNPIRYSDKTGLGPWSSVLSLFDYRKIHNMVADRVASFVGIWARREVYVTGKVNGKTCRGFLDVFDSMSYTYYEVKSYTAAYTTATQNQMRKYDNSKPPNYKRGNVRRGTKKLSGSFWYGAWLIKYSSSPTVNGLVTYEPKYNTGRADTAKSVITTAIVIGLVILAIGLIIGIASTGIGAGVLAFV